jgi:hypothetical protein
VLGPYSRISRMITGQPRQALQQLADAIKVVLAQLC